MKTILKIFFLVFIVSLLISLYFYFEEIKIFVFNILINLQILKDKNFIYFLFLLTLVNFFYLLTPIPSTLLIIFNGFVLGTYGFILSICFISICSSILFTAPKYFNFSFFSENINKYRKKIFLLQKESSFFLLIFVTRYLIPYFFHCILFGLIYKKLNYFIFFSILAEMPVIYALNNFGKHLNTFTQSYDLSEIMNLELLISVVIFLIVVIFISLLKKKFKF